MFEFHVKCYKRKEALLLSWGAQGKAVLSPHYLFYSYSVHCVSWAVSLVRKVNTVLAISGGITRRDICFPLELGDDWR